MWAVCSHLVDLRWTPGGGIINQQLAGGVCLFTTLFALFPAVQFARFCVLCAAMHSLRCILSLYTSHHVTCDGSHATLILFLPDVGHMNVGPRCMLHCIQGCTISQFSVANTQKYAVLSSKMPIRVLIRNSEYVSYTVTDVTGSNKRKQLLGQRAMGNVGVSDALRIRETRTQPLNAAPSGLM